MKIKSFLLKIKPIKYYAIGKKFLNNVEYIDTRKKSLGEMEKSPTRTEIINFLLSLKQKDTCYLEIGVRRPEVNFNHIKASVKYSVDPFVDIDKPIHFKMTSDAFFLKLSNNEILSKEVKFDLIFIDGLHLAHQVDKDIENALNYINEDGFVVLHDCNPPTEWHARESQIFPFTPARKVWNGTTWKAFLKWRFNPLLYSCCIDSDFGVGILSKNKLLGNNIKQINPFFEFSSLDSNREEYLNLIDFDTLKSKLISKDEE